MSLTPVMQRPLRVAAAPRAAGDKRRGAHQDWATGDGGPLAPGLPRRGCAPMLPSSEYVMEPEAVGRVPRKLWM